MILIIYLVIVYFLWDAEFHWSVNNSLAAIGVEETKPDTKERFFVFIVLHSIFVLIFFPFFLYLLLLLPWAMVFINSERALRYATRFVPKDKQQAFINKALRKPINSPARPNVTAEQNSSPKRHSTEEPSAAPDKNNSDIMLWIKRRAEEREARYALMEKINKENLQSKDELAIANIFLKKTAAQGNITSQSLLGVMYYLGHNVEKDHQKSFEYFKAAAEKNEPNAPAFLGEMYYLGQGVEQNHEEALNWFKKAFEATKAEAERGTSNAQYELVFMYIYGIGTEKNTLEGLKCLKRAAEQGHPLAKVQLKGFMEHLNKSPKG